MSSISPDPAASAYYSIYKSAVYYNLFVGIAWVGNKPLCCYSALIYVLQLIAGIFVTFYAVSVYTLLGRPGLLSSRSRIFMLGMTTLMFVLSLIALVLEITFGFQQARSVL
ncbi:hypothetical protein BGW80DRAFT_1364355, partial [Lactifluus volemus]